MHLSLYVRKRDKILKMIERERKILEYICLGLNNQEIGEKMYLSKHTVKKEITKILAKYQARNRVELVSKAFKSGVINLKKAMD